ncbi:LysM peptidoglycan-binding domain-containing protein [Novosphingobium colocasiae]|uniref:LysM peptidoglycan-binding domain-containing protein n=1 Tax=Novosphingobium colocasiae TaxID=1256513 RepID=UPI0035ADA5DD
MDNGHYVVRAGDSLGRIAEAHRTSVDTLVALNAIADPDRVRTGLVLRLPGRKPLTVSASDPWAADNLRLPSANERYRAALVEAAQRTGLPASTIATIVDAEAAKQRGTGQWDPRSKAATSSATGLTQFLDRTWRSEARRAGGLLNAEARAAGCVNAAHAITDDGALLALRCDPRVAILAGADFAVVNLAQLARMRALPARPDPAAAAKLAYLAHHEGTGRAAAFLNGRMGYVTPAILAANVPHPARRRALIAAAGGQTGLAYRRWMCAYVDANIDVCRFMIDKTGVTVPPLASLCR